MRMIFRMKCISICRVRIRHKFAMEIASNQTDTSTMERTRNNELPEAMKEPVPPGINKEKEKKNESGMETVWPRPQARCGA